MTQAPLVSIITPMYNSARFVSETVQSVKDQSFRDWEMIVVDDASTDNSADIVAKLASQDDRILLIVLDVNSGAAVARNTAIDKARGRYIAFLDSDDQWLPDKLEKQITFMEHNQYSLTHTYYEKITEVGERTGILVMPPKRLSYTDMLKSNQMGCLSTVYDTARFGKVYMPPIRARQDFGLWLDLLRKEQFAYCLPEPLALYRLRSGSASSNKFEMISYNWFLYRRVESLSILRSSYYLGWNIVRKFTN